jgi:glycosyltransferase involved in cell wall biosynthesis
MMLSIVVPCYNEASNLPVLMSRFLALVEDRDDIEIILVNNGSKDNTAEILACELQKSEYRHFRTATVPINQGYGHGIRTGLAAARGTLLGWTHADLQTDPGDLVRAYDYFAETANPQNLFVRGHRVGRKYFDWFFTFGMSCVSFLTLRMWLHDVNAQPKMFHRAFYTTWVSPPDDFSLDLFVLYHAKRQGLTFKSIPVHFAQRHAGVAKGGGTLLGKWKLIVRTLKYIWKLKSELKSQPKRTDETIYSELRRAA